jgi:transmembrane sensor
MKTVVNFPDRITVEAEACAWIAQLDGDQPPSAEDAAALREWINRSPLHRAELERLTELWGDMNILTELAIPLDNPQDNQAGDYLSWLFTPFATRGRAVLAATILVFGITSVFTFWLPNESNSPIDLVYSTEVGEQQLARLPDGSAIQLNTDTQIEVDYDNERRKIRLLRGQAHFDVARNPNRPFVVYAGTGRVRAVGTAFSVRLRGTDIEVTVTEGAVTLESVENAATSSGSNDIRFPDPAAELAVLRAGQSTIFNHEIDVIRSIEEAEMARKLSWRDGMLVFSGESLEYVVEEVSRYAPISIEFSDPELRDLRIGGYFRVGETEALFEVLESNFGVQVNHISHEIVQLSSANK